MTETSHNFSSVAVIGASQMAADNHLPVLHACGIKPTWIIDPNLERAQAIKAQFTGSIVAKNVALSSLTPPHLVLITCPFGVRDAYYQELATAWPESAILIEKPIALTVAQHDSISSLRKLYCIASGYSKRSFGSVRFVQQIIESQTFGELRECEIAFGGIGVKSAGKYTSNLLLAGGGTLFEVATHCIDAVNFILNALHPRVERVEMEFDFGIDVHTDAKYTLDTPYGTIPCKLLVSTLTRTENRIAFIFDDARLEVALFAEGIHVQSRNSKLRFELNIPQCFRVPKPGATSIYGLWRDFITGIENRKVNYTNLSECRVTTEVVEKLYVGAGRAL